MKKRFLFLILIILINGCVNTSQNIRELYQPPVCGNGICEDSEEFYCLDCNLSCKSEFCNSQINLICDRCTETQKELLPVLFEHQTIVYNCLSNYFGYHPLRLVYHTVAHNNIVEPCFKKEGCYVSGGGFGGKEGIKQGFIPGLREYGEIDVTKEENVGFEIHELIHVFTEYNLGVIPAWFNEGISIYTESRVSCHPNQVLSGKIDNFLGIYNLLKTGNTTLNNIAPYDQYYEVKHNAHIIGALYFCALEQDYNCNKDCIAKILYSLNEYREDCTGICFENAKKSVPLIMNFSLNSKDLRIPIITNNIIKQKSETIINQNLTNLFGMLEINI